MVLDRLEERLRFGLVRITTACRLGLPWPIHGSVRRMSLPEDVPVLRVPRVVQGLHPLQVLFTVHRSTSAQNLIRRTVGAALVPLPMAVRSAGCGVERNAAGIGVAASPTSLAVAVARFGDREESDAGGSKLDVSSGNG